jgi:RNA polymerase sigma factor (sigma-70 family)
LLLALRLKQGDSAALEEVLRALGPRIGSGLKKRHSTLSPEDLEDVLAVACHRLWQSRLHYDPKKGSLAGWFFRIADRVAIDLLRKVGRRVECLMESERLAQQPTPSPVEKMEPAFGWLAELGQILVKLSPRDHRIISEYALAGGAGPWAADLAGELGIPAGSIRVRCHRIKEKIRKEFRSRGLVEAEEAC